MATRITNTSSSNRQLKYLIGGSEMGLTLNEKNILETYYFYLKSKNLTEKTILGYSERLGYLVRYSSSINKTLLELTSGDIRQYFVSIIDKVKPITINGRRKIWCLFFDFIKEQGLEPSGDNWKNPLKDIPKMKESQRSWRLVTPDEMSGMIRYYSKKKNFVGIRNQCLLLLAWDCMLRLNELLSLKISDVELKPEKLIKIVGKGRKERLLSFSNVTALKLSLYLNIYRKELPGQLLFPSLNNRKIDLRQGHRIFDFAGEKVGLPMRVGCHLVRRSSATHYWKKIKNIYLIKVILGHSDIRTTELYVQAGVEDVIKAYNEVTPAEDLTI